MAKPKEDNFIHLMQVPFTGLGLHGGYRGDEWFKNRIKLFKQFVIPSLLNQTNHNFVLWLCFRPEEEQNPIAQELIEYLNMIRGLKTVVSYGGCPFYDDKFNDVDRLLARLKVMLPPLADLIGDKEWVYVTIQPSDDMYLSDAVEKIQQVKPANKKACGFQSGYIMNYRTKEVAEYNPTTNPPFYTLIFPTQTFLDPNKHLAYAGVITSHEYVPQHFKDYIVLHGRGFVVGTHGENISTTYNIPFKGRLLNQAERERIWILTGNLFTEPSTIHNSKRIIWRERLNKLPQPLRNWVKPLYYKIPGIH